MASCEEGPPSGEAPTLRQWLLGAHEFMLGRRLAEKATHWRHCPQTSPHHEEDRKQATSMNEQKEKATNSGFERDLILSKWHILIHQRSLFCLLFFCILLGFFFLTRLLQFCIGCWLLLYIFVFLDTDDNRFRYCKRNHKNDLISLSSIILWLCAALVWMRVDGLAILRNNDFVFFVVIFCLNFASFLEPCLFLSHSHTS